MVLNFTDDFQVTWADPARANESWVHDRLHAPWAQPPLTQALFERIMAVAFGVPTVFVNSYGFMRDFGPPQATPEVEEAGRSRSGSRISSRTSASPVSRCGIGTTRRCRRFSWPSACHSISRRRRRSFATRRS